MDLVKSWLGQALRATGAAIVVPVAILAALSLAALGDEGGLGSLGSLSRIVSGPEVAGSDVSVDDGDSEIADAVTQLAASNPVSSSPGIGGSPTTPGGINDFSGTAPAPGGTVPGGGGSPPGGGQPPDDIGGGGGGGGGTQPPSAPPPAPPEPGVVGGIGESLKDATGGTPVAPTVEDAVDTLVETCGRLGCP